MRLWYTHLGSTDNKNKYDYIIIKRRASDVNKRILNFILVILLIIPLFSGISFSTIHMENINLEKYNAIDIHVNPIDDKVTPSDSGWMYTSGTGKRAIKTGSKIWGYFNTRGKWRASFNQNVTSYTYDYIRITSNEDFVRLEREVTGAYKPQPDKSPYIS